MPTEMLRRLGCLLAPGVALLLAGCEREQIQVYRVPKETKMASAAEVDSHAGHDHDQSPHLPRLRWTLPAGWTEQPASGMRVAKFSIAGKTDEPDAEVTAIPLLGTRANEADVVNILRENIRLTSLSADQAAAQAEAVVVADGAGNLYEMVSNEPLFEGQKARAIAVLHKRRETLWIFKLFGGDALAASQKEPFKEFLKTLVFDDIPTDETSPIAAAPRPAVDSSTERGGARPEWQVPETWKEGAPPSMALAGFTITGNSGAKASVSVTPLPGDGGGTALNINRWRNQLGLPTIADSEVDRLVTTLDLKGERAVLVDMAGKDSRLVGAIVLRSRNSWFVKMTGDNAVVGREKEAFVNFVKSIRFPNG